MTTRPRYATAVALIAAAALTVASCGSSGSTGASGADSAPADTSGSASDSGTSASGTSGSAGTASSDTTSAESSAEGSSAAPAEPEHVSVILDFHFDASYGSLAYGLDQGYFADAGVDLDVIPGQGGELAMQQINSGKVDFAFTDLSSYLRQKIKGETDTTAVYAWVPDPQICIASLTKIEDPQDMEGKTFATVSFSNGRTTVPYVLQQHGVDIDTVTIQVLDISVLIPQLLQGAVDTAESAVPGSFASNKLTAEKAGKKLYCTPLSDWGYKDYGKMLIVSNSLIKSNPDLVKRTVGAFDRSVQEAMNNATGEQIFEALKKQVPQTDKDNALLAWKLWDQIKASPGPIDKSFVEYSLAFLADTEDLTTDAAPESFYDNSYIPTS